MLFNYGEGVKKNPTATVKTTILKWISMCSGNVDITSAHMSGNLQVEGNHKVRKIQELSSLMKFKV